MKHLLPITCTHRYMQKVGYHGGRVDRMTGLISHDWLGWCDCLYRWPGKMGMVGIQVTSRSNLSTHIKKYEEDDVVRKEIVDWILSGHQAWIHGWKYKEKEKAYSLIEYLGYEEEGRLIWKLGINASQLHPEDYLKK